MKDDFLLYEDDDRRRPVRLLLIPVWFHHFLTAVAIVVWFAFAAWADLDGVVALLGVGLILWLRRLDYLGDR